MRFLNENVGFTLYDKEHNIADQAEVVVKSGFLRTSPLTVGMDGFFAAVLKRG
ncbi:MAG: hypothetical protein LBL30_01160 [Holosporales bacterium]|nr:hypothetical protein [Holosporales bacterium]